MAFVGLQAATRPAWKPAQRKKKKPLLMGRHLMRGAKTPSGSGGGGNKHQGQLAAQRSKGQGILQSAFTRHRKKLGG